MRRLLAVGVVILAWAAVTAGCGGRRGIAPAVTPRKVVASNPAPGPSGPPDLRKLRK